MHCFSYAIQGPGVKSPTAGTGSLDWTAHDVERLPFVGSASIDVLALSFAKDPPHERLYHQGLQVPKNFKLLLLQWSEGRLKHVKDIGQGFRQHSSFTGGLL